MNVIGKETLYLLYKQQKVFLDRSRLIGSVFDVRNKVITQKNKLLDWNQVIFLAIGFDDISAEILF